MDPVCVAASVLKKFHVPNAQGLLAEQRTEDGKNPFVLPDEAEFRCQEAGKKLLNRGGGGLPVWKRGSKRNNLGGSSSLQATLYRPKSSNHRNDDNGVRKSEGKGQEKVAELRSGSTPATAPMVTAGSLVVERSEKESVHDLLAKKREIFFMRMNIENKVRGWEIFSET